MEKKRALVFLETLLIGIFLIAISAGASTTPVFGTTSSPSFANWQYAEPSFNTYYTKENIYTYWPILKDIENDQCNAASDFVIMIRPGSCTPLVVRSDLLEEQNVPVFCPLDAIRVNPLIQVSSIKSISFKGTKPEEVVGIQFHPARAAIRSYNTVLGSPILNNIGYVVIVLKKNPKEKTMPDWIAGNLTAIISYDAEKAYGTGKAEYYLPLISEDEWNSQYKDYGFWNGKGFLKLKDAENGQAKIELYTDKEHLFNEVVLKEGETSRMFYFPGFYCKAGLQVKLNKIVSPEEQARLNVDGEDIWVRKGSKILNDRCSVKEISPIKEGDGTGSISIYCPGDSFDLILGKKGAEFSIADLPEKFEVELGKKVSDNLYLGYVGVLPDKVKTTETENKNREFVLLVESSSELERKDLANIAEAVSQVSSQKKDIPVKDFKTELGKATTGLTGSEKVFVLVKDSEKDDIEINKKIIKITFKGIQNELKEKDYNSGSEIEDNFKKGNKSVEELLEAYSNVEKLTGFFGEEVLWRYADLAHVLKKQKSERDYLNKILELYPNSKSIEKAKERAMILDSYDVSNSARSVYVNNEFHYISVERFKAIDKTDKNVVLRVGSMNSGEKIEGDKIPYGEEEKSSYVLVKKIEPEKVELEFYEFKESKTEKKESKVLGEKNSELQNSIDWGGKAVSVVKISVRKEAYVSLIPKVSNTKTEANFSFKVGIEKRLIQLSTNKTKEMIENLNKTIKKWDDINKKLEKLVKTWKGVCFATSAGLMAKNLIFGFSGESMARQKVMQDYKQICNEKIDKGEFKTRTECYNKLSSEINNGVSSMTNSIQKVNSEIADIEKNYAESKGLFGEKVIESDKVLNDYRAKYKDQIKIDVNGKKETVDVNYLSLSEMRDWALLENMKSDAQLSSEFKSYIVQRQKNILEPGYQKQVKQADVNKFEKTFGATGGIVSLGEKSQSFSLNELKGVNDNLKGKIGSLDGKEKAQLIEYNNKYYLGVVSPQGTDPNTYTISRLYLIQDGAIVPGDLMPPASSTERSLTGEQKVAKLISGKYDFITGGNCRNPYKSPVAKFYETSPNVQMPAIIPFDTDNGWYVYVPQTKGGIFSSQEKGYQASGAVSFFYICNVGTNGREENMKGDDICQSFDVNTYDKVDSFANCNMAPSEVQKLARKAVSAVKEAAQQYGGDKQIKQIRISGVKELINVAAPLTGVGDFVECQDFMSPEECKLLFNACDPVICPASRCNLGGRFPVADVVQSGIIGSLILCLPNFNEGVYVPVCLTGIWAGIDAYLSILKSERDCLQKSLDTGEHVGICDEVTSIYLCEFFWRQIGPFLDTLIPTIIEWSYTGFQGARGGGEYLTVQNSWDTMQKSVDYFKNTYAQNSFRAFQFRNIQEAGGEFCRAFIGTSVPTGDMLDSLLQPESPVQFYARFDEVPFTEATVPATSHYKVYYHIYAGKDKGSQFAVYLKSPPASGYYAVNPFISVKTGYVPVGDSVDEALDFTAPSGYKELCVVIDAQTSCGFESVSTSFALEYLKKKYVEEQAENFDITSEKECVSGSPSVYSLIKPNLQAGAEQALSPEANLRGIVRVCATKNPAESVDKNYNNSELARWKEVGYCDNKNIKCWLDTKSVEGDLKELYAIEGSLSKTDSKVLGEKNTALMEETRDKLNNLRKDIESLETELKKSGLESNKEKISKTISELDNISSIESGNVNYDKAEAIVLKSEVYRIVVKYLFDNLKDEIVKKDEVKGAINTGETTKQETEQPQLGEETIAAGKTGEEAIKLVSFVKTLDELRGTIEIPLKFKYLKIENTCSSIKIYKNVEWWFDDNLGRGLIPLDGFNPGSKNKYSLKIYCYDQDKKLIGGDPVSFILIRVDTAPYSGEELAS